MNNFNFAWWLLFGLVTAVAIALIISVNKLRARVSDLEKK